MKRLLLALGFFLLVVSCGGGGSNPTPVANNWHKHQPGEWVWIDWPDGVPTSWSDKITPDNIGVATYRSQYGTTLGTAPNAGDQGVFYYFWDVADWCATNAAGTLGVCDSNNKIWNPLQTDEADFVWCWTEWHYAWVDFATAKLNTADWSQNSGGCQIHRYHGNDLLTLSGEQLGNGGWECMSFADSNEPTAQTLTAPYYITGNTGSCLMATTPMLGSHMQYSPVGTYSIGQANVDEHIFFGWGSDNMSCDEAPSSSKEFGPLAFLGIWSWAGDFNHNGSPIACPIGPNGSWALPDWEDTNPDTSTHP